MTPSEAHKEKVIECSNRWKDSLHETIGPSSIQYHKNCYITYASNDITYASNEHINRYSKRECAEEPGTSKVKWSRRFSSILRKTVLYVRTLWRY